MPTWSIITVTYNSAITLRKFWHSDPSDDVEWIVVDNASSDGSGDVARRLGATKVIRMAQNEGFASANNVGLAQAQGDLVLFANPDLRVRFEDMHILADQIMTVGGFVAPQLVNDDGTMQPNGRGLPTLGAKVLNRIAPGGGHAKYRKYAAAGESKAVVWLMGAAVAGRRVDFTRISGWSERFFLYYEDSDLGLRGWANGLPSTVMGELNWVHGWARETKGPRFKPWKREITSMWAFYTQYPLLLLPAWLVRRRQLLALPI